MSLRRSVRACAERILASGEPVHVLVHNAGVLPRRAARDRGGLRADVRDERARAASAHAPAARPPRSRARPRACIFVSSGGMYTRRLDVDDLQSRGGAVRRHASPTRAAKRAEVVLAERWAEELAGTRGRRALDAPGLGRHARHQDARSRPSSASCGPLLRSPEQGADTIVWLAAAEEPAEVTGRFWCDRHVRSTHRARPHAARRPRIGIGSGMRWTRSQRVPPRGYDLTRGND